MLKRLAALTLAIGLLSVSTAQSARAGGGGGGYVRCHAGSTSPDCIVTVTSPGHAGGAGTPRPVASTGTKIEAGCAIGGRPAPCSLPGYGWLGANGCYYRHDPTYSPPPNDTADQPPAGQAGGYYDVSCFGTTGTGEATVWLPAGTAPGPPPAPAVLAEEATNRLQLSVGGIDASPPATGEQLVNLPTWVWLPRWAPAVATATIPGEKVTAIARPVSARWSFGDGAITVCSGPGTPYQSTVAAAAPSPTCGHTYTTSSAAEPSGAFPVTVTVTWDVTWTGGGQAGFEPPLTATESTGFRVAESQAVNTAPEANG